MITIPEAYELIRREDIPDVHAEGYLLRHKKSGARVALLSNDDENKVFNIAFRTPPADSTGVAHIIEHTVLCGSRKYPLKDPFIELVKGSLNTFLNAMTYPDKTMFPVASCNDVDFRNLMDVYLDAVFYPNIYREEKIFRQEGWHYHLENRDDPLTLNGVVYNEMKGAFSSSDEVLSRIVMNTLFPDTAYGVESGGDPDVIPTLTYEDFLAFHKKYYHPSNSYIYLYGNMDMEERLDWMDRAYLSKFDSSAVDSEIRFQKPFEKPVYVKEYYPILDDESTDRNTYLEESMVIGDTMDVTLNVAFTILDYVLLSSPGAPVRQALLDAHIGEEVYGSYEDGILQPYFSVVAKNADEEQQEQFLQIIRDVLADQAKNGIDKTALASGINFFEFRFREADYASYPKGLIYGLELFESWLYDENRPFDYLKQLDVFETLKKKADEGYFEDLIRKYLLDNPFRCVVTLAPKKGMQKEKEEETAKKLAAYKDSLPDEEVDRIVAETEALREYQESEESEEAIASLPHLTRGDIGKKTPVRICREETDVGGTKLLHQNYFTNGIGYLTVLFDAKKVPDELTEYMGLLKSVLGMVSTEHYHYGKLFHVINANTGGISCGIQTFSDPDAEMKFDCFFGVQARYLLPKQKFVFEMIREILLTSKIDDKKRLREIIASMKVSMQSSMTSAGHVTAAKRAMSYLTPVDGWHERADGIDFYRFIEDADAHFEERIDDLIEGMRKLLVLLFRPENMIVSITASGEELDEADRAAEGGGFEELRSEIVSMKEALAEFDRSMEDYYEEAKTGFVWKPEAKNEGWKTSGQVQYAATAGNFIQRGFAYTGALRILKTILSYDYLWTNLRVKGGAYGCMALFQKNGDAVLVSYRDPHLKRTLEVYRGLPEYLKNFEADEDEMTKYIIGTISEMDTPMNAAAKGAVSLESHFSGFSEADYQKERDEILSADDGTIRALEEMSHVIADTENICVIGSEAAIDREADTFRFTGPLVRS
ncbi:MAG: insulinase family protein [Bilifractor sp.]|jgi:Zn-dependent M16 (insulinase) family peptidase